MMKALYYVEPTVPLDATGDDFIGEAIQVDELDKKVVDVFNKAIGTQEEPEEPFEIGKPTPIKKEDLDDLKKHANIVDLSSKVVFEDAVPSTVVNKLEVASMADEKRTLQIGIIGVGGAGNKIADAFAEVGYDAMVVNLTDRDFAHLKNIPQDEYSRVELIVGAGGAGKIQRSESRRLRSIQMSFLRKSNASSTTKSLSSLLMGWVEALVRWVGPWLLR